MFVLLSWTNEDDASLLYEEDGKLMKFKSNADAVVFAENNLNGNWEVVDLRT